MPSNVTREDVVERPNKYGTFDDDLDTLVDILNGKAPTAQPQPVEVVKRNPRPIPEDSNAEYWEGIRELLNNRVHSESKYGR